MYRGCYAFERHLSILICDIKSDKFYTVASLSFEISGEIVGLIASYKAKNKQVLDGYVPSISSLLFLALDVG